MFTASLPPIPDGADKAHRTLTPAAHALPVAGMARPPAECGVTPPDYERTCTPENGCDLHSAPAEPARAAQPHQKGEAP